MNIIKKIKRKIRQSFRPWSSNYWDNRYIGGGNSGAGSYGKLAVFKNKIITGFCEKNGVTELLEFGSGDGNQTSLLPPHIRYTGLDISPEAVSICKKKFENDTNKKFILFSGRKGFCEKHHLSAPVTLSLDVIYHLIEDETFENYVSELFSSSKRYVIIYSSDKADSREVVHVKHRKFTDYVRAHFQNFSLIKHIPNDFSPDKGLDEESFADFFIYEKAND